MRHHSDPATFVTVNPATEEVLAEYRGHTSAEIDRALDGARGALRQWRIRGFDERAAVLRRVAAALRGDSAECSRLITTEMGKPLAEAEAEVEKCARGCEFFADNAAQMLADEVIPSSAAHSYITYEPVGVVLGIMPWNFPLWQVMRFTAPAMMVGNAVVLKHAPNVTGCALALRGLLASAGVPAGIFDILIVAPEETEHTVSRLIADGRVDAVTFTGSDRAGRAVGTAAGAAIKKAVLELGGSDPFIILADAKLETVVTQAVAARFLNAGQSCVSPKRFIVDRRLASDFTELLVEEVSALVVGDPCQEGTQVGPLARLDLLETLERQVDATAEDGAELLLGGRRMERRGFFYTPSVMANVAPGMTAAREELFGPVAVVLEAADDDEAIALANDTSYGLGASIWTADVMHAQQLAREVQSGTVFVNGMVLSDPRLPFGGTKRSGYGRELGAAGIREFSNLRTIWLGPQSDDGDAEPAGD